MKAYMYILNCADGSYYTGSTTELDARVVQHQNGEGSIYTRERLPVKLVHFEEYPRIDREFWREQQVKKWSRKKKEAAFFKFGCDKQPLRQFTCRRRHQSPRYLYQPSNDEAAL